ncbi:MAG: hypothetical protein R2795_12190 [Saprospiraceae bacterium]
MDAKFLKQRLLRARYALNQTLHNILNINRKRKILNESKEFQNEIIRLDDELKVLNRLATTQVTLIKKYEKHKASKAEA